MRLLGMRSAVAGVAGALLLGCTEDPVRPELPDLPDCVGELAVSAESTIEGLEFSWTPACRLNILTVEPAQPDPPLVFWGLSAERAFIAPPIRYGSVPPGAGQTVGPVDLDPQRTYRIRVMHNVGGDVITAHGETTFTP